MSRTRFVCGNWKLNNTIAQSLELATTVKNALGPLRNVEVAIAPPFTALAAVHKRIEGSALELAAQDCYWEEKGAFTGAISPHLLADVGCKYVIIGHSERRQLFGETDANCARKVQAVLHTKLRPILCVGETDKERDAGHTFSRVGSQLDGSLAGANAEQLKHVTIAYEPVWAIGTGRTATPAQAEEVHAFIRKRLHEQFGHVADSIRIQYGGSVKPDNAALLLSQPNIDGALVGGASLKAEDFLAIVKA
jgi:triosephosphate isomerase